MKAKVQFYCTECGNELPKWAGQCPACHAWNTITERPAESKRKAAGSSMSVSMRESGRTSLRLPKQMKEIEATHELRFETGMQWTRTASWAGERSRAPWSWWAAPLGSENPRSCSRSATTSAAFPRCSMSLAKSRNGRSSCAQSAFRSTAMDSICSRETNLEEVVEAVHSLNPDILIIDSIQTLYNGDLSTAPGSVGQVKECTMTLMQLAKGSGVTIFVIGHVNKEGSIAGPKVLEHMVDCVLYFEGEQQMAYRILRAAKNRFGATNEIGVFEMADHGLSEVPNPSEMLLDGRPQDTPGTCVTCVMEGVRPVLAEVQALLAPTSFNVPRRTSNGFDFNRAVLLLAVLEKRGGLMVSTCDAYINVIGGLSLEEPAADLAMIMALASSFRDKPIPNDLTAIGEVGLTGELRSVSALGQRLSEVRRMGFTKCLIPARSSGTLSVPDGLQLIRVKNIREALAAIL